jgi:hypothetical protein
MVDDREYVWMECYRAALVEPNPDKLKQLVPAAQAAVQARIRELLPDLVNHHAERQAIEDALQNLRVLERELPKEV